MTVEKATELFVNEMAHSTFSNFDDVFDELINILQLSGANENAKTELNNNGIAVLFFILVTVLNAWAVNNIFEKYNCDRILKAIKSSLLQMKIIEDNISSLIRVYDLCFDEIKSGLDESTPLLLPMDTVAGTFISLAGITRFEGTETQISKNETIVSPVLLTLISELFMRYVGWWKLFSEKYTIK